MVLSKLPIVGIYFPLTSEIPNLANTGLIKLKLNYNDDKIELVTGAFSHGLKNITSPPAIILAVSWAF